MKKKPREYFSRFLQVLKKNNKGRVLLPYDSPDGIKLLRDSILLLLYTVF